MDLVREYIRKALRLVLKLGYRFDADDLTIDVSDITDRDGSHFLVKHCPGLQESIRVEARFYPSETDGMFGGRLHIHFLWMDNNEVGLPAGGVIAEFDGVQPNGLPELVDALVGA